MKPEAKKVAPTAPEETEPTAELRAVPVWLFVSLALLMYWGALYFDARGGGFNAQVYEPYRSFEEVATLQPKSPEGEMFAKGRRVFQVYCMVCHQASGLGTPGQFPPLAGSEWVLTASPNRIIRLVLNGGQGPIEVKGQTFGAAAMPPWKDLLKDEDIAAALTYVRQNKEWGNSAPEVKPEQIKVIRDKIKDRSDPFSADELKGIPEND
jgi:mono/diheme cytochrome c family protein